MKRLMKRSTPKHGSSAAARLFALFVSTSRRDDVLGDLDEEYTTFLLPHMLLDQSTNQPTLIGRMQEL